MKDSFDRHVYRILLATAIFVLAFGTIFYRYIEHWSWIDSYYFSVVSLTTVGYGDLTPHTNAGKIFTTFYLMFGIGIITTFISYSIRRRGEILSERRNNSEKRRT
jgi:voltage-gated potassium channel